MGLNDWWNKRTEDADNFLSTGVFNNVVRDWANQDDDHHKISSVFSFLGDCTSSSQCPAGYACVGNTCAKQSSSGSGNGTPYTSGLSDCNDPNSDCNGANGCQSTPNCGETDAQQCCGTRCCGFGSPSSSNPGVQCYCGPCPKQASCNDFCAGYLAANGVVGPGCSEGSNGNSCGSCSYCSAGECRPLSGGPCWCGDGNNCAVECEKCVTDPESPNYGDCIHSDEGCQSCATIFNYLCECNYVLPEVTACKSLPLQGVQPINLAQQKAAALCDETCQQPNPCLPQCENKTFCTDTGTGVAACPAGYTQTGTLTVGEETCVFCQKCSTEGLPDSCKDCDCNCNDDCGDCEICAADGTCQPDPKCYEDHISTWNIDVPSYEVVGFAGGGSCDAGNVNTIQPNTITYTSGCGPLPHTIEQVDVCDYFIPVITNANNCPQKVTSPSEGFFQVIPTWNIIDGDGNNIGTIQGTGPVGWSGGAHPSTTEPGCTSPYIDSVEKC